MVTKEWEAVHAENLKIFELYDHTEVVCYEFSESLELVNSATSDRMTFTNTFTKYSVEFGGIFIGWLESSNYKLLNRVHIFPFGMKVGNLSNQNNIAYITD